MRLEVDDDTVITAIVCVLGIEREYVGTLAGCFAEYPQQLGCRMRKLTLRVDASLGSDEAFLRACRVAPL